MATEQHKQRDLRYSNPYADYEYTGKGSRQPWRTLLLPLILGFGLWAFAFFRWQEMASAEHSGDTISMTSLEWGLYEISGKWGFAIFITAVGTMFIYAGIRQYRRLEKMKRS